MKSLFLFGIAIAVLVLVCGCINQTTITKEQAIDIASGTEEVKEFLNLYPDAGLNVKKRCVDVNNCETSWSWGVAYETGGEGWCPCYGGADCEEYCEKGDIQLFPDNDRPKDGCCCSPFCTCAHELIVLIELTPEGRIIDQWPSNADYIINDKYCELDSECLSTGCCDYLPYDCFNTFYDTRRMHECVSGELSCPPETGQKCKCINGTCGSVNETKSNHNNITK